MLNKIPKNNSKNKIKNDSISNVAPFRIVNLGNQKRIYLNNFIKTIENNLQKRAIKNYISMQKGDVLSTLSDAKLLRRITNYNPQTSYKLGIKKFVGWFRDYYK